MAAVFTVAAGWLYAPVVLKLVRQWWLDPDYSHAFLVAFGLLAACARVVGGDAARPQWAHR